MHTTCTSRAYHVQCTQHRIQYHVSSLAKVITHITALYKSYRAVLNDRDIYKSRIWDCVTLYIFPYVPVCVCNTITRCHAPGQILTPIWYFCGTHFRAPDIFTVLSLAGLCHVVWILSSDWLMPDITYLIKPILQYEVWVLLGFFLLF